MKKRLKRCIALILTGVIVVGSIALVANASILFDVITDGIKIVVDGKKLNPTDANGNAVEPMIYNGTTYLPVRAVANALGKAVYWDGPNYTVYLGEVPGGLEYPTLQLEDTTNIGDRFYKVGSGKLVDNYGNSYASAIYQEYSGTFTFQSLLNMKYSRFKGTIYVPEGCSTGNIAKVVIKTDGKTVFSSPEITKTSAPIPIDVNIKGCNDFQIEVTNGRNLGYIADAGFYQ